MKLRSTTRSSVSSKQLARTALSRTRSAYSCVAAPNLIAPVPSLCPPVSCPSSLATHEQSCESVTVGTMHLAKGLEFKVVVVLACDDGVLPLQERIDTVSDEAERGGLRDRTTPPLRR